VELSLLICAAHFEKHLSVKNLPGMGLFYCLSFYFSIRRQFALKAGKIILSTKIHLAKHFTPTYGAKTVDNNFLGSYIRSESDNNIRRWTLPVSGVYLNNFPFLICLTPGPSYVVITFKVFHHFRKQAISFY